MNPEERRLFAELVRRMQRGVFWGHSEEHAAAGRLAASLERPTSIPVWVTTPR